MPKEPQKKFKAYPERRSTLHQKMYRISTTLPGVWGALMGVHAQKSKHTITVALDTPTRAPHHTFSRPYLRSTCSHSQGWLATGEEKSEVFRKGTRHQLWSDSRPRRPKHGPPIKAPISLQEAGEREPTLGSTAWWVQWEHWPVLWLFS